VHCIDAATIRYLCYGEINWSRPFSRPVLAVSV